MSTPHEMLAEFKRLGHFDALRHTLLSRYTSSPHGIALLAGLAQTKYQDASFGGLVALLSRSYSKNKMEGELRMLLRGDLKGEIRDKVRAILNGNNDKVGIPNGEKRDIGKEVDIQVIEKKTDVGLEVDTPLTEKKTDLGLDDVDITGLEKKTHLGPDDVDIVVEKKAALGLEEEKSKVPKHPYDQIHPLKDSRDPVDQIQSVEESEQPIVQSQSSNDVIYSSGNQVLNTLEEGNENDKEDCEKRKCDIVHEIVKRIKSDENLV